MFSSSVYTSTLHAKVQALTIGAPNEGNSRVDYRSIKFNYMQALSWEAVCVC